MRATMYGDIQWQNRLSRDDVKDQNFPSYDNVN